MDTRPLGTTGHEVTEIGMGTWNVGSDWGDVSPAEGRDAIRAALDAGVTFLDTADVYGGGQSEELIADVVAEHEASPIIATKAGRGLEQHTAGGYTRENIERFIDDSRARLGVDALDLLQLHCPPTDVYYRPEVFEALESLVEAGKIDAYGASVARVEEGLKAIEYPGLETVQIIFNPFRQRPAELFLEEAARRDIGVIVRVPLASGLLADALDSESTFPENDHRNYNRDGDAFDVGETFAGVPFERGLEAVDALRPAVPDDWTMAQFTLRWILDHDAVSTVIPGSTNPSHVRQNVEVSSLSSLNSTQRQIVDDVYEGHIRDEVHHRW